MCSTNLHFCYSSDKPWESNSTFPMLACLNTVISVLKGHCGVIVKLQICVVGLFQTTGLIFHPLSASIDWNVAGSLLSQKMSTFSGDLSSVKWEKSAHTFHFFRNEHPGMTKNRAPTWGMRGQWGGGGGKWWNCSETHISKRNTTCNLCEIPLLLVKHGNSSPRCSRTSVLICSVDG